MAFKVSSTLVVDNFANISPGNVINPGSMPINVSISGPGNYNPYAVARVTGAIGDPNSYAPAYRVYISGYVLYFY